MNNTPWLAESSSFLYLIYTYDAKEFETLTHLFYERKLHFNSLSPINFTLSLLSPRKLTFSVVKYFTLTLSTYNPGPWFKLYLKHVDMGVCNTWQGRLAFKLYIKIPSKTLRKCGGSNFNLFLHPLAYLGSKRWCSLSAYYHCLISLEAFVSCAYFVLRCDEVLVLPPVEWLVGIQNLGLWPPNGVVWGVSSYFMCLYI